MLRHRNGSYQVLWITLIPSDTTKKYLEVCYVNLLNVLLCDPVELLARPSTSEN